MFAAIVGAVLVAAAALVAVIWWGGSSGREVTVDEAQRRLDPPSGSSDSSDSPTTSSPEAVLVPPQGVYLFRGGGTDTLSTPPKEQVEGPDMPATVQHGENGCWTFRIDYHSNHWQSWEYCSRSGRLEETGGSTFQRWDFGVFVVDTTSTFTCDDAVTIRPDAEPGDDWTQTCRGKGDESTGGLETVSTGPYRFVGRETLTIGGRDVEALHHRRERTMSGGQRGTEVSNVWFAADDGMPLRNERVIEARTDTVIGETTYREDADFELTDLSPAASGG